MTWESQDWGHLLKILQLGAIRPWICLDIWIYAPWIYLYVIWIYMDLCKRFYGFIRIYDWIRTDQPAEKVSTEKTVICIINSRILEAESKKRLAKLRFNRYFWRNGQNNYFCVKISRIYDSDGKYGKIRAKKQRGRPHGLGEPKT